MTGPTFGSGAAEHGPFADPVLALDLGGTNLRTAVVLPDGSLVGRLMTATPAVAADDLVRRCAAQLGESLAASRHTGAEPRLLTISAPGPLDPVGGVLIDPPNLDRSLWGYALAPRLGAALGLPAIIERDTQVAALAEGAFGAARSLTDYVYLTVSTGVGGAVVSGGRLMRGPDGVAGELGHLVVDVNGPRCGCGARGHLEALVSGTGLAAQARTAVEAGNVERESPLGRRVDEHGVEQLQGVDVAVAEEAGDPVAADIMSRARRSFAAALVSIVDVFNPQRVIVGGGVAVGQGERLLAPGRERVAAESFRTQARRAEIVAAELGDDVGLIGGLALARLDRLEPNEMSAGRKALPNRARMPEHVGHRHEQQDGAVVG
jgi:glucokinase